MGFLTCWSLWNNRNSCFHNLRCKTPSAILVEVQRLLDEYKEANSQGSHQVWSRDNAWRAPTEGVVKLNVDASFRPVLGAASVGVVARNHRGEILLSAAKKLCPVVDSLQAELAIQYGLCLATEFAYQHILVESDCLLAVNEIHKQGESFSEWYGLVKDIVEATLPFFSCAITHVHREVNRLADSVAKSLAWDCSCMIWRDCLPPDVCNNLDVIHQ
ncbi:hypothetical protein PTKIN_Ptkin18bG0048700 [Pterospermum kingtungense]